MISAGDVLKGTINRLGLAPKIKAHQIWYIWDKVLGPHISSVAQPERIKFKTLFVNVKDNVWLGHLKFLESMIIDKLNGTIGAKVVEKIYFKLGNFEKKDSFDSKGLENRKVEGSGNSEVNPSTPHLLNSSIPNVNLSYIKDTDLKNTIQRIIFKTAAIDKT